MYVVSIEVEGDGSSNWTGQNRPGISVFTEKKELLKALHYYFAENEDIILKDSELEKIIEKGGVYLNGISDRSNKIRIEHVVPNPKTLVKDHWYRWDLPENAGNIADYEKQEAVSFHWTQDEVQKAYKNHYYMEIGSKEVTEFQKLDFSITITGVIQSPKMKSVVRIGIIDHILLIDAPNRWKNLETAGDVYIPSLRVAGNPDMIKQIFVNMGISSSIINQYLASGYTAFNYNTTMKDQFDVEIAAYLIY